MLELKAAGTVVSPKVVEDLRSAKSMIQLTYTDGSHGDVLQKAEEYLANVEAYVITEGQTVFGAAKVDEWLRRLEEASCQVCEEPAISDKFVAGCSSEPKVRANRAQGRFNTRKSRSHSKSPCYAGQSAARWQTCSLRVPREPQSLHKTGNSRKTQNIAHATHRRFFGCLG